MCRLAFYSGVTDKHDIAFALSELELSFGGDGNGYYDIEKDEVKKGIFLSCTDIARKTSDGGAYLFHTRMASAGGVSSDLCHPFRVSGPGGEFALAHNGHWYSWEDYNAEKYEAESDTQLISKLLAEHGIGVLLSRALDFAGMFLCVDVETQDVYHINRSGNFRTIRLRPGSKGEPAFFHASEWLWALKDEQIGKSHELPKDCAYVLGLDGKARRRELDAVEPERLRSTMRRGSRIYTWNPVTEELEEDIESRPLPEEFDGWVPGRFLKESPWDDDTTAWECFCYHDYMCDACTDFYSKWPDCQPVLVAEPKGDDDYVKSTWGKFDLCGICMEGSFSDPCRHCGFKRDEVAKMEGEEVALARWMWNADKKEAKEPKDDEDVTPVTHFMTITEQEGLFNEEESYVSKALAKRSG